jgi:HAD superfamily hydrolase (TIGR01509 family)
VLEDEGEEGREGEGGREVVFFEDSFKNLMAAKELGMKTVLICKYNNQEKG